MVSLKFPLILSGQWNITTVYTYSLYYMVDSFELQDDILWV